MRELDESRYNSIVRNSDGWYAAVVSDSTSGISNVRLVTLELFYPRIPIHEEFLTHRVFSRNSASNRAIPFKKVLKEVREHPALPFAIYKDKKGMSGDVRLSEEEEKQVREDFKAIAKDAAYVAEELCNIYTIHKQTINRLLQPYQFILTVVTATEWLNFFKQRLQDDAQPEIKELARLIYQAMKESETYYMFRDDWHLPYIKPEEEEMELIDQIKISVGRCANRSSYRGDLDDTDKCIALCDTLEKDKHLSPFEHPAKVSSSPNKMHSNLRTWVSYRAHLEEGYDISIRERMKKHKIIEKRWKNAKES